MASTEEQLGNVLAGAMAYGWPYSGAGRVKTSDEPMRGWLRLATDGSIEFESLVDDPWASGPGQPPVPNSLFLSTRHGAVLLPQLDSRVGGHRAFGGSKASVHVYRAPFLIFGVDAEDVLTNRVTRLAVRYFGMGPWAGLDMSQTEVQTTADGLVSSATLTLRSAPAQRLEQQLPNSLTLVLEGDWVLGTDDDGQRRVSTALRVVVEGKRPRPVSDLVVVLHDIQDLLALLRGGLTLASTANLRSGEARVSPTLFWTSRLMRQDPRAVIATERADLRLTLDELGGARTIARWCHLAAQHRDITFALTSLYRDGPDTVDMTLLRLGVAVEFWVARHKGKSWAAAKKQPGGWHYSHSLAHHLGPAFAAFVGDPDRWASRFWDAYLDAKHPRGRSADPELQWALARTARLALAAELLNASAGSRRAGDAWFADLRHGQIGEHYRSLP